MGIRVPDILCWMIFSWQSSVPHTPLRLSWRLSMCKLLWERPKNLNWALYTELNKPTYVFRFLNRQVWTDVLMQTALLKQAGITFLACWRWTLCILFKPVSKTKRPNKSPSDSKNNEPASKEDIPKPRFPIRSSAIQRKNSCNAALRHFWDSAGKTKGSSRKQATARVVFQDASLGVSVVPGYRNATARDSSPASGGFLPSTS